MTENEFCKLPLSDRLAMPEDAIYLQTREQATEMLTLEGWKLVDVHSDDTAEVWKRKIGRVVEWVELFRNDNPSALEPERCWLVAPSPIDPRLIVD